MSKYYRLTKIDSLNDINGKKPWKKLIVGNRCAGKTYSVLEKQIKHFSDTGRKCMMILRAKNQLNACHLCYTEVFKNLGIDGELTSKPFAKGMFYGMYVDEELFGFSVSLKSSDDLKKFSPVFSEVDIMLFDEFQKEDGKYLSNEPDLLQSIYMSVARGGGAQVRGVELYMCSNDVSIMNPYYISFGIYKRLHPNTKTLKGDGWVLDITHNISAINALNESNILGGFSGKYCAYASGFEELVASETFIQKASGKSIYMATIVYDNKKFGVRNFYENGYIHISEKIDPSFPTVLACDDKSHNTTTLVLRRFMYIWEQIRTAYDMGALRFDNINSKNAIFDILAIDLYK